ncbi:MAG: VanZ family protein, partial [Woeseiaceae bacterium]|nr:VanZ family protein [Woeseiaceae bacterium]
MTAHRRTNAILIGAAVVVGLVIVIALHRYEPEGMSSLGSKALRSLHGPGFAAVAIVVYFGLRRRLSGWSRIGAAFGLCAGVGVLAELSQIPGPRNADISDLITNTMGIVAGLALVAAFDRDVDLGESPWPRRLVAVAATAALAYVLAPTAWMTAAATARKVNLPVLLSFESTLETRLYRGMGAPAPVRV